MNIVLDPTSAKKATKNKLQLRFDKLQQQLLKQQKLNHKFHTEVDELTTIYQTQLHQIDSEQVAPLTLLTNKLIKFYSRKSLSQWQRVELGEWIVEIIDRIGPLQAKTANELLGLFRQTVANQMGITEEELDKQNAQVVEELYESFNDEESTSETDFDTDDTQQDKFRFEDDGKKETADEHYGDQGNSFNHEFSNKKTRHQQLMDGSWIQSLFRRAAQVLHPDREPDPQQRQTKQRAMQQLLKARKQGDIMTLLRLYSECAGNDKLILAEHEMTSACDLMESQLNALRMEKNAFLYQHPLRLLVHDLFYSRSRKTSEKKIQAWIQDLQAEADFTLNLIEEMRNLQVLKAVLERRRETRFIDSIYIV